ncbi:MAG: hypothetical protein KatS3mg097_229 [Candidatus Parcubacteria bacterium]|nr:MAG: hypothetical protein KatS3mg097_229 [Candidatus Parcubacteria bacterium]
MNLKEKIKDKFYQKLFIIIILLNLLSFGLGFIIGSQMLIPNPIIINGNC